MVDVWSIMAPFAKFAAYMTMFGASGTGLFLLHFGGSLSQATSGYCELILRRSAKGGILAAIFLFATIVGNIGGDIQSIIDPMILELAASSKGGRATFILLAGFIAIFLWGGRLSITMMVIGMTGILLTLSSFALVGHATNAGPIAQLPLVIHLLGLSYWLGSFLPLRELCISPSDAFKIHDIAHRFGIYAMGYVGGLLLAGILFAYLLLGDLSLLFTSTYGNVLLAKLAVVCLLLLLGAINKLNLVPFLLNDPQTGSRRLRKSIHLEMMLSLFVLATTGFLTTSVSLPG